MDEKDRSIGDLLFHMDPEKYHPKTNIAMEHHLFLMGDTMFKRLIFHCHAWSLGVYSHLKGKDRLPSVILQGRAVKLQGCNMAVAQDEAASFKMTNLVDGYCNVGGL